MPITLKAHPMRIAATRKSAKVPTSVRGLPVSLFSSECKFLYHDRFEEEFNRTWKEVSPAGPRNPPKRKTKRPPP